MAYWLAIGPTENWDFGLGKGGIWGVKERYHKTWERMGKNDVLFFYAMKPVKGIVGYGTIVSRERRSEPFWPEEKKGGMALWPLHLHVKADFCLSRDEWETQAVPLPALSQGITIQRAIQELRKEVAEDLLAEFSRLRR